MSDILYAFALILIFGWFLGFFVFSAGALIHILFVMAIVSLLLRLIGGRRI